MKYLNHPFVHAFIGAIQIYVGLMALNIVPGMSGTGTTFSKILGSALILLGVFRFVKLFLQLKKST